MCGIAVQFRRDGQSVSDDTLLRMCRAVVHRGPDDYGTFTDGPVGLGMRRLEVIDLAGGHQPMSSRSGRLTIVCNGEIYNYRDLRRHLLDRGIELRTKSDTETILGMYQLYGARCVEHLVGMFAFALWDAAQRTLLVARDRLGIKPLYLLRTPEGLAFASEIKSFFVAGLAQPRLRREAVPEFLRYRCLQGGATLYQGVQEVPPGEVIVVSIAGERHERYWQLPQPGARVEPMPAPLWLERVEAELSRVVTDHLVADVPVGTWSSGGVGSSLVTAFAARGEALGINTYAVGFEDQRFDESRYADVVGKLYATQHHQLQVAPPRYAELLEEAVWFNDLPLNHPHSVHLMALARLARERVKVVLTGEGADELFGGYPRYRLPRILDRLPRARWVNQALRGFAATLAEQPRARLRGVVASDGAIRIAGLAAFVETDNVRAVLLPGSEWELDPRAHLVVPRDASALGAALRLDQETYLQALVHRLDRMTMAGSIEGRVPFLDHRLVELAARVPPELRVRGLDCKWLIKRIAERHVPRELVRRPKSGLTVPIADWLRAGGALERYRNLLLERRTLERGLFSPRVLERMVEEHRSGVGDHAELLRGLINLELWQRLHLEGGGDRFERNFRTSGEIKVGTGEARDGGEIVTVSSGEGVERARRPSEYRTAE